MEKFVKPTSIILAFLSILMLPASLYGSIIIAAVALLVPIITIKDYKFSNKILQVTLITFFSAVIIGIFNIITAIISYLINTFGNAYSSNFYLAIQDIETFIVAIVYLLALIFAIIAIVKLSLKQDIPMFGLIANKITGTKAYEDLEKSNSENQNKDSIKEKKKDSKNKKELEPENQETPEDGENS